MIGKLLAPTIEEMIHERQFRAIKEQLSLLNAADLADIIMDIDDALLSVVFRLLPTDKAAEVFEHLDLDYQQNLLASLSKEKVKALLEEMSVDDRTYLLDELPPDVASQLISLLPHDDRTMTQMILNYPEDSAGRLVTPDYVSLRLDMTVQEALDKIRLFGKDMETVYACYVIGEHRKLLGIVSLRKLVTTQLDTKIEEIYETNFVSLRTSTDQEEALELFRRYDLIALPVVDSNGCMVGIVTFDDIMDVAAEEFREDMDRMAAVVPGSDVGFLEEKRRSEIFRRVPWLMVLLVVQAAAVFILQRYDQLLEFHIALSFFLPALIATGGNTGTQSASMVIRAIATGEVVLTDLARIALRAIAIGLALAAMLGVAAYVMALLINRDPIIGLCVGIGVATVVILANLAGSILPLILKKLGLDPALMSSPFISTIVDIFGLVVYMEISRMILS